MRTLIALALVVGVSRAVAGTAVANGGDPAGPDLLANSTLRGGGRSEKDLPKSAGPSADLPTS
jgi:hypothetical protein